MHEKVYKIEKINSFAFGVYSRNFGSEGGWHQLRCFFTYDEAERFIKSLNRTYDEAERYIKGLK